MSDHPDKVLTSAAKTETHLAPKLRQVVDATKWELFLVSPYFVPGKQGVDLLARVRRRGARVVVITNSLASTDGVPVHSKYQGYRKRLLQAVSAALHAKTFAFDRRIGFIGSYNLDPRSNKLNTEMGVLFDCPKMVRRLPRRSSATWRRCIRVELVGNRLGWVTREGGKEIRFEAEPEASLSKRIKVRVLSWLPIEGLLRVCRQNRPSNSCASFSLHSSRWCLPLRSRWGLIRRRRRKSMS